MKKYVGIISMIISALVLIILIEINANKNELDSKFIQAQYVYTELLKYTGVPGFPNPLLQYSDTDMINAWTDGKNVTITKGMLDFVKNPNEVAFILGHEIGHIMLGHIIIGAALDQRLNEANADKYGTYLVLRAGYDVCDGKGVWQRFIDTYGNGILTQDHPSEADRAESLKFPQCGELI